jgi:hypothetical protein
MAGLSVINMVAKGKGHPAFAASQKERGSGVPVLMVRRTGTRQTALLVAFSPQVKQAEPDGIEVRLGKLRTAQRFATDYEAP